ncbi:DUF2523 family protein [Vibrio cincinnatiensis]|uniref:DUF2523 family protein n=1 Tax=Vibrio cincinnatiensis TaxID=675 RepID=UPI001EDE6220|nr:DUF2523 family protein [Vibrio cincinnatiensis]MCG3721385.1 DUF2523 domain-containing protein [Vibrio cincinnatiensis]
MQYILDFLAFLSSVGDTVVAFFQNIPTYFKDFFVYLGAWSVKIKFMFFIFSISRSYEVAVFLLEDLGVTQMVAQLYNALPSELRYYLHLLGIPQALSIIFNCGATAFVMRIMRM